LVKLGGWAAAALLIAAAAGGCGGDADDAPTPIDCAWLAGDNCWRASAAAATACTDAAATGTLDGTTTTCSYADGTAVRFATSLGASLQDPTSWDFTVVSSTATACARYVQSGPASATLTTRLGSLSMSRAGDPMVLTCPDGSRFGMAWDVAATCPDLAGWTMTHFPGTGTTEFVLLGAPPGDGVLWRCR
jgi:hypothetical protein